MLYIYSAPCFQRLHKLMLAKKTLNLFDLPVKMIYNRDVNASKFNKRKA